MQIPQLIRTHKPFVSLEFYPPKKKEEWPGFLEVAKKLAHLQPLFVSVTYGAGGSTQSNTLEICEQLIQTCDFEVMPHLTGVAANQGKVDEFIDAISGLNIENVLALRGDRPSTYTGPDSELFAGFPHAEHLVSHIRSHHPHMAIGVAGFPEAHAEALSFADDLEVMRRKVECGADFVITQLYFDNRTYFDYVDRLRTRGVNVPIVPGILPIRSLSSLRFILEMCNARIPGRLINALMKANDEGGAKAVYEIGVAYARQQVKELLDGGAPGVHLYTLNKADMCLQLMDGLLV